MIAVIQLLTRVKVTCGQAPVRYWNSSGSKGKSDALKAGVRHMFVQIKAARHPRSEIARPSMRVKKIWLCILVSVS